MAFKGVDIRQSGDRILFRALLQDDAGALVTTGTTVLKLYELQSDGTLFSYDFNDDTFKSGALTTETLAMTHRQGDNSTTNTGLWTVAHATLTDFVAGNIYFAMVNNVLATPADQIREFQFAGAGVGPENALTAYDPPTKTEMDNSFATTDAKLARVFGLCLGNMVEDDIARDGDDNKTQSVLYLYDSKANAVTHDKITGLVGKYEANFTYAAALLSLMRVTEEA